MEDPVQDIRRVVRALCEPRHATKMLEAVDTYFSPDAIIVHPMLNSPASQGREGVKAAYKMLRVLTLNNKIDFHAVAFDRIYTKDGREYRTGLLDLTEHLQIRFFPLPASINPTFHIRFLTRLDLMKEEGIWYIQKQEDNLPTDFSSTGLEIVPGLVTFSNTLKWVAGWGTRATATILTKLNLFS